MVVVVKTLSPFNEFAPLLKSRFYAVYFFWVNVNSLENTFKKTTHNKSKIFHDLEKKSYFFQKKLNQFIKENNINAFVYRFKSIIRLVYTNKKVTNRIQRDFLESKNVKNIQKLRNFFFKNKIYYPTSGIIFMSTSISKDDLKFLIKIFKQGLKKFVI